MARAKLADAFETYDIKLLIGGSRNNEIRLSGVSAPEVILLKVLHGPDAVVEMKAAGPAEDVDEEGKKHIRGERAERMRLYDKFEARREHRAGFITRVFGPNTIPLPRSVDPDFAPDAIEADVAPKNAQGSLDPAAALMA